MAYKVTARKWRPQIFSEVVYQDHVSKTLQNSIQSGRISHAYLFAGPRGVGKTTMARILAKALNCVDGPTAHPCGVCTNCIEIRNGNSFDVIEIDGASNNGVDDIRDLREKVNFAPVKSKYKIYIIDEVHMVTTQAFNALLKTLEEPPPHVVFIFATTEIHKIPDTILSRCQKFFFKTIPTDHMVLHLRHIVAKEGFEVSETALYPIARAAQGSMRDAQSLLDQLISFSGHGKHDPSEAKEIGQEDALSLLGIVPIDSYCALLKYIAQGDAGAALIEVDRIVSLGADIPRYVDGFAEIIRTLRLIRHRITVKDLLGLSSDEVDLMEGVAPLFTDEELGLLFRINDELHRNLRFSSNERINLEMALLDMVGVMKTPSLTSVLKRLDNMGGGSSSPQEKPAAIAHAKGTQNHEAQREESTSENKSSAPMGIENAWVHFLESTRNDKQYLHFVLKPSHVTFTEDIIEITYPSGSDHSYYGRILDGKNLRYIEERMSALTGKRIKLKVGFTETSMASDNGVQRNDGKLSAKKKESDTRVGNNPDDTLIVPTPDSHMLKTPEVSEYESKNPTVEKIKNVFHGQIVKKGENDA